MTDSPKTLAEVRRQLGFGTIVMLLGVIWFFVILYGLQPDQILPTNEDVQAALGDFKTQLMTLSGQWNFDNVVSIFSKFAVLFVTDILFVIIRYGGLTLFFLGGFMIFEAVSKAPRESR
jgi:hypothetical protein